MEDRKALLVIDMQKGPSRQKRQDMMPKELFNE
ncbi:MAG: hypothetical protein ACI9SG_001132 [Maribacter sp.]|jgi:hypothetical protein